MFYKECYSFAQDVILSKQKMKNVSSSKVKAYDRFILLFSDYFFLCFDSTIHRNYLF